jgi:hypothetical protein
MMEARLMNPRNHRWLKVTEQHSRQPRQLLALTHLTGRPAAAMGARPTARGKSTCIAIEGCRRTACVGALMTHTDPYPLLWPH